MVLVQPLDVPYQETAVYRVNGEQQVGIVMPVAQQRLDLRVQRVGSVIYRRRGVCGDRVYRSRVTVKFKDKLIIEISFLFHFELPQTLVRVNAVW